MSKSSLEKTGTGKTGNGRHLAGCAGCVKIAKNRKLTIPAPGLGRRLISCNLEKNNDQINGKDDS